MSDSWAVSLRPLSRDVISGEGLGDPVFTLQFRLGLRYRAGAEMATVADRAAAAAAGRARALRLGGGPGARDTAAGRGAA